MKSIVGNVKDSDGYGKYDFVGKVGLFGGISVVMVLVSLIYLVVRGVPYGIDFAGGTEMQIKFSSPVSIEDLRGLVAAQGIKDASVQAIGEESEFILRFQSPKGATEKETNEISNRAVNELRLGIDQKFASQGPEIRRVDSVGPQVGKELRINGFLSVFYCLLVILIYVGLRFDYKYAPGAVICLFHDVVITLGIFVLVGKEVNVPILAAIMTLIGFSLNDTIVVFDRIRETEATYKNKGIRFVINKAINDMLSRTLITSGTTFVSSLALYFLAGGMVSDIAFAICIGILFGTYSSIYVAAPFMLLVEKLKGGGGPSGASTFPA